MANETLVHDSVVLVKLEWITIQKLLGLILILFALLLNLSSQVSGSIDLHLLFLEDFSE